MAENECSSKLTSYVYGDMGLRVINRRHELTLINFEMMSKTVHKQIGFQSDMKTLIICNNF